MPIGPGMACAAPVCETPLKRESDTTAALPVMVMPLLSSCAVAGVAARAMARLPRPIRVLRINNPSKFLTSRPVLVEEGGSMPRRHEGVSGRRVAAPLHRVAQYQK